MPNPPLLAETLGGFFEGFRSDERFVLIIVGIVFATGLIIITIGIIAGVINSIQKRNALIDLKREMLDRGMSAEEIQQVIQASPLPSDAIGRRIATWGDRHKK